MTCCTDDCTLVAVQPDCVNLLVQRGTDNSLEAIITDGDGAAVNITTDTVIFTVKESREGSLIFQKSNGPGSHSNAAQGKTIFNIDKTDIDDEANETTATYWVYDVRRVDGSGDELIHIRGDFTVEATV